MSNLSDLHPAKPELGCVEHLHSEDGKSHSILVIATMPLSFAEMLSLVKAWLHEKTKGECENVRSA